MKPKKGTYKAVYVEWIDSTMKLPVWFSTERLVEKTHSPEDKFQTVSYLVNENKLEYIFASSIHFDEDGVVGFGQVFTIPKGCVTKMKKITIWEKKNQLTLDKT